MSVGFDPSQGERWRQFFGKDYLRFSAFILTSCRTAAEVDAIQELLGQREGLRVLDLGCGAGRIAVSLAAAGHDIVGLDGSAAMLDQARLAAADAGVRVDFVLADMREMNWVEAFDAVLNVGTAFGYVADQEDDRRILGNVTRALRPGGRFILETENRERVLQGLGLRPWFELGGTMIWSERRFEPLTGRWQETLQWLDSGQIRVAVHELRLYSATELAHMIREAGMEVTGLFGSLNQLVYAVDSARTVLTAQRARR